MKASILVAGYVGALLGAWFLTSTVTALVVAVVVVTIVWAVFIIATDDTPYQPDEPAVARGWTPEDAREVSGRSNSFRPYADPWASDPDRTTRRDTYL